MAKQELIDGLNDQMNREITTFLRYMRQGASIKGHAYNAVREMYLQEVQDEVEHAQYLANMIEMLGGKPKMTPDLAEPPTEVPDMLKKDMEAEAADVKNYQKLAELADAEGLMSLKLKMEDQAGDEDEHRLKMMRLLG